MADRTVPHAYPMSVNYEMCTPARIYDQNFAEGKWSVTRIPALIQAISGIHLAEKFIGCVCYKFFER